MIDKNRFCLVALAALLATACAHPACAQDQTKDQSQTQDQSQDQGTLTLRSAVTLALDNSSELKLARVQYNVALKEAGLDRAAFMPNLYTGSGAAYSYGFPALPGGNAPSLFQLSYTESIFNPYLKGQQHADEERAKSQKLQVDDMQDTVIIHAATAYLELAKVRHSLDLLRDEEASAEKILQVTHERVDANQELPIEVTRGELALARVEERIVKLEGRDDILTQQIHDLTGLPEDQAISVGTEEPDFSTDQETSAMVTMAIASDRGIQEAEDERAAREHILRGARLSYLPTVDFIGQYSILSKFNNYLEFYKHFSRNNLTAGVQVTIPIFAAKTSATVALAKSQLDAAELTLGNKRQDVRLAVQQKVRDVRELDASREVARLDLKLAQENLQLIQAKYDQGQATLPDLEQAHLDESDKWVAFLDADFARQQGQLTLLQVTGQLAKVFQ
jgi:outer membrane protein